MSMVTRCPACGTGFRVSAGQLKAQQGKVRCGRCSTVFNAFETLYTLPDAQPQPPAPPASNPEPGTPEAAMTAVAPEAAMTAVDLDAAEPSRAAPRAAQPAVSGMFVPEVPAPRRRSGAWAAGSFVLLLLLAAQLAYVFRTEIADARPQARPWLEQACDQLGCTVPYPRNIQQWSIESSDLQSDPDDPARMTLTAVLRNRAPFTQGYPALELTLTDVQDRAVARRVLGAQDYLPPGTGSGPGLGPNAEVTLRVAMATGRLNAAGYRLYLFYP